MSPTPVDVGWMLEWHLEYNFNYHVNGYGKWLVMKGPYIRDGSDWLLGAIRRMRKAIGYDRREETAKEVRSQAQSFYVSPRDDRSGEE